jgi:hypothetical protein
MSMRQTEEKQRGRTGPTKEEWVDLLSASEPDARSVLRFSDRDDVAIALEECIEALRNVLRTGRSTWWKRAISSMQRALQSALTVAASDSVGLGALDDRSRRKVWKHVAGRGEHPSHIRDLEFSKLIDVLDQKGHALPILLRKSALKINGLRTVLDHPKPNQLNAIMLDGAPSLMRDGAMAIRWLLENCDEWQVRFEVSEIMLLSEKLQLLLKAVVIWAPDVFAPEWLAAKHRTSGARLLQPNGRLEQDACEQVP